jgi:hypothetical protein
VNAGFGVPKDLLQKRDLERACRDLVPNGYKSALKSSKKDEFRSIFDDIRYYDIIVYFN